MIVGVIDHFEVWDLDSWEQYLKEADDSYEDMSDNLEEGNDK